MVVLLLCRHHKNIQLPFFMSFTPVNSGAGFHAGSDVWYMMCPLPLRSKPLTQLISETTAKLIMHRLDAEDNS